MAAHGVGVAQAEPACKHTIATQKCYQYNTIQYNTIQYHYDPCKLNLAANSRAAYSVECSVRNPYWLSYKCCCVLKKLSNWEYIIFSKIFEIAGSRDIGIWVHN